MIKDSPAGVLVSYRLVSRANQRVLLKQSKKSRLKEAGKLVLSRDGQHLTSLGVSQGPGFTRLRFTNLIGVLKNGKGTINNSFDKFSAPFNISVINNGRDRWL